MLQQGSVVGSPQGAEYVTNSVITREFAWTPPQRTVTQAWQLAFPKGDGWKDVTFSEGSAGGRAWTQMAVVQWVEHELLGGLDPFAAHNGMVPVPFSAKAGGKFPTPEDQLDPGQWVGYSRRQLCFIVAKSLVGSKTVGYDNGLSRFMLKRTSGGCAPVQGDFGRAWWGFLVTCAADPLLNNGAQGPLLLAAQALPPPTVETVRLQGRTAPIAGAGLRLCRYDDGSGGAALPGIDAVPVEGCTQPSDTGPGRDFMTGGLMGQAVQDISAKFLGGYIYGNVCDLGGGQDERLMAFMPEVSALTFFLSQAGPDGVFGPPQLRQPAWILGARRLRVGIDGTCRFEAKFELDPAVPFTSDLVTVQLRGKSYSMSGSKPFLAFMSENQGFLGWPEAADSIRAARRNKEPRQRATVGKAAFANQVRAWYRSVALTSYDHEIRPLLRSVVRSVGTGPWLAGLWWGDSQLGMLASWLGHAIAAQSWGGGLPLDYYVYSAFTENPGNQCFVHSAAACQACLASCASKRLPAGSYWLPGNARMTADMSNPCVISEADCGARGFEQIVATYSMGSATELWKHVEDVLTRTRGNTAATVFDLMGTA